MKVQSVHPNGQSRAQPWCSAGAADGRLPALHDDASALCKAAAAAQAASCPECSGNTPVSPAWDINTLLIHLPAASRGNLRAGQELLQLLVPVQGQDAVAEKSKNCLRHNFCWGYNCIFPAQFLLSRAGCHRAETSGDSASIL